LERSSGWGGSSLRVFFETLFHLKLKGGYGGRYVGNERWFCGVEVTMAQITLHFGDETI